MLLAIVIGTLDHLHQGKHLFNPFYVARISKATKAKRRIVICSFVGGFVAYLAVLLFAYNPLFSAQTMAFVAFCSVPMVHDGRITKAVEAFEKKP